MRKPRIGRNGQDPIGAGRAQPRCSLSLSHKHEVFSITAADTALDVAAHTLARCRVRLGPPRRALPPNAKLEHSWLLSSIFNCPDILNAVLTRTAPVPRAIWWDWRDRGTTRRLSWGYSRMRRANTPALWMVPARTRFFYSHRTALLRLHSLLFPANECSPDLFRQTEITFAPRNCEIPVGGWDFF